MSRSRFDTGMMTGREKNMTTPSRRVRRMVVLGFYLSFPLWWWLLYSINHGGAFPEGIAGYDNLEPWLAFSFFAIFAFCAFQLYRSNVGGLFFGPRDERQQAALVRTYSLSYSILSALILIPGSALAVSVMFFDFRFVPTSGGWFLVACSLATVSASLPKAVAMWLEPDPIPELPHERVPSGHR